MRQKDQISESIGICTKRVFAEFCSGWLVGGCYIIYSEDIGGGGGCGSAAFSQGLVITIIFIRLLK